LTEVEDLAFLDPLKERYNTLELDIGQRADLICCHDSPVAPGAAYADQAAGWLDCRTQVDPAAGRLWQG
jgi:hypothetical protein